MAENQMSFLLFYTVSSIPLVSYIFTKKKASQCKFQNIICAQNTLGIRM